ncbi:MAG: hypothetical protein IT436_10725 [Phycisphaerales bacterium]|nr:hypothetical protein [Phycisphaerales bacterium]
MNSQGSTNRRRAWALTLAVGGVTGVMAAMGVAAGQPEVPPATSPAEAGRPVAPAQPQGGAQPPVAAQPQDGAPPEGAIQPEEPLPEIGGDELITLTAFTEPVELSALVEYAATTLGINVTVKGSLAGTVTFNAPVSIPKSKLLPLVDALLDQHGWTITLDPTGFYIVQQRAEVPVNFDGEMPTTKIIPTPNVRPSALRSAISAQFGTATPGVPDQPGSSATKGIAYVDELGVIVATDSPRRLAAIETLVRKLMGEYLKSSFSRLELEYVAAPVARDRALALVGQSSPTSRFPFQEQQQQQPQLQGRSAAVDNLADRLTVDPQGNALIFRGAEAEIEQVRAILKVIDVPTSLQPKPYEVGSSAKQIANIARDRGLGEVTSITSDAERQLQYQFQGYPQDIFRQQSPGSTTGGPVMVVDETRGRIIYYGTEKQHVQFTTLVATLGVEDERIVLQPYRLKNAKAEDVATLIQGLLTNQTPTGESSLLPQGQGGTRAGSRFQQQPPANRPNQPGQPDTAARPGEEGMSFTAGEETFVIADVSNNQVIVKAPAKLQPQFKQLIDRIDLRRAQVYIECKIVAVNWTDEMRLAFETQLINAGGTGGVLNTNFGLSSFPTGTQLNQPKTVATGLTGLTAALIKSDQIPIIITALQREVDSRILSSPQLLVDDNEEASIVSIDEQPTTTVSQGTSTTETGFGGYEKAGTNLTVTPHISEAGYIRLEYEAELSNFTGQATADLPPPRQTNTISAKSVTLPTDFTVVLGGLNLDSRNRTVVKVPLLGDIPYIGALFSDDNKNNRKTTLYVFLTPRILKDENFNDLKNLTRGPQYKSKLDPDIPEMKPSMMDVLRYGGEPHEPEPLLPAGDSAVAPVAASPGTPGGRIEPRPGDEKKPEPPTEISPDDEPGSGR